MLHTNYLTVNHQVTLKENADEAELKKAKDQSKEQGGEIKHEFTLIKGFTYVLYLSPSLSLSRSLSTSRLHCPLSCIPHLPLT
jgi:hypothetical protein